MKSWRKILFTLTAAALPTAAVQADMTAMERAHRFGLSDIRGIAYIPGPQGPEKPLDPRFGGVLPYFQGEIQTYDLQGNPYYQPGDPNNPKAKLNAKYTIYYDSDFYNADFRQLWGKDAPGGVDRQGRDDLGRYKVELNANFIHLYDWTTSRKLRNHDPFLTYADQLGMHVTIPISNYTYKIICGSESGNWQENVKQVFRDIYEDDRIPDPAAGVLKIFNEFDGSECQRADLVAQIALYWKDLEDQRNIPDRNRLPIIFPVTFSIKYGLPGGAVLDVFNAIIAEPRLGLNFWKARVIYATNPFNDGPFMRNWIENDLPAWFMGRNIPTNTPVMFTEYGRSLNESNPPTETGQAEWVKDQFQSMWRPSKPAYFLGACAFVNEYRFWLAAPEPNFALTDFNRGGGAWNKPRVTYIMTEKYQNPNAPMGERWEAKYQVDPQKPRPAYCEVARVYGAPSSGDCP